MSAMLAAHPGAGEGVNFAVLSSAPLIAVTNSCDKIFRAIGHAVELSKGRPAQLFVRVSAEIDWHAPHLKDVSAFLAAKAPDVHLKFLATNEKAASVLGALGLASVLCSPAAFVDEYTMYPLVPQTKSWDAVYNARFLSVKRHELAALVPSLALIGAPWGTAIAESEAIRAAIPHAAFLNYDGAGQYRNIPRDEVRALVNRARVGLILSETEGANLASIEYLLCGVPVVSTPPQGGRELFLPPEVCEIAEPDPRTVVGAVRRLIARRIDPFVVRETALSLVRPHRETFARELSAAFVRLDAPQMARVSPSLPYALLKYRPMPASPV